MRSRYLSDTVGVGEGPGNAGLFQTDRSASDLPAADTGAMDPTDRPYWPVGVQQPSGAIRAVPMPEWAIPVNNGLAASTFVSQLRWVRVMLFAQLRVEYEIPLIDANGIPFCDPAIPPMAVMSGTFLRASDEGSDPIGTGAEDSYWPSDQRWANMKAAAHIEDQYFKHFHLVMVRDPVPHWVLRLSFMGNNPVFPGSATPLVSSILVVDMLTNGAGGLASEVESGSADTYGHYSIRNRWTDQSFLSDSDRSAYNERGMFVQMIPSLTHGSTTSGAFDDDAGTPAPLLDTSVAPMWRSFRQLFSLGYSTISYRDQSPFSWSQGIDRSTPDPPLYPWTCESGFWTAMSIILGVWKVQLAYNNAASYTSPTTAGFFTYAVGLRNSGHGTPTNDCREYWDEVAAGALSWGGIAKYVAFTEMVDALTIIHWTADGSWTGASVFEDAWTPPWVEIMISEEGDDRKFGQATRSGIVSWDGATPGADESAFYYGTVRTDNAFSWGYPNAGSPPAGASTHWVTMITARGDAYRNLQGNPGPKRVIAAHAIGKPNA